MNDEVWYPLEGFSVDAPSNPARAKLNGEVILVFRTPTGFRGAERLCPHLKFSLSDAVLMANGTVLRCAQHNFTFKLSTGRGVNSPSHCLRVFEIKVEEGMGYGRLVN